jgi:hypothetical protein
VRVCVCECVGWLVVHKFIMARIQNELGINSLRFFYLLVLRT